MYCTDLHYLHQNWANLKAALTPGTPRPYRALEPWITREPGPQNPGKAPLHLDTFDLLLALEQDTTGWLQQAGQEPAAPMPGPLVQLDTLLRIAARAGGSWAQDVTAWAEFTAHQVRAHLEGESAGQTLQASCPFCGTWGSLRVRLLRLSTHAEPYVTCESGICTPGRDYCTSFLGARPVWPMSEWRWLAGLLSIQAAAEVA